MTRIRYWLFVPLLLLSLFVFTSGTDDRDFRITKNLEIFFSLFRELNTYYVDDTDPEKLISSAIDGMLTTLDPYTNYISESALADFKFMTTGEYAGIGSIIRKKNDYVAISELYRHSPADKAGLKVGDLLLSANGKSLQNMDPDEVSELLKGDSGTNLKLDFFRPGVSKKLSIELLRQHISLPNVPYYSMIKPGIGYISLREFTPGAAQEVRKALLSLKQGRSLSGLILDLRGNPGGMLMEAVEVVNLFVPRGQDVVGTHGKVKQLDNVYKTRKEPLDTIVPLVVLVNRMSASAAEIVAGALQDLDRAVIVGQRTYGKGLVQTTRPLSYNAQLKVTISKYYIPSGRCIQALDYSRREEDGSIGTIPDSLIKEFRTLRNARIVRDGGGIAPDVEVLPEVLSHIAYNLYSKDLIFDFVSDYMLRQDSIPGPERFRLSNAEYASFVAYAHNQKFEYLIGSEEKFKDLKETAIKESFDVSSPVFVTLEQMMTLAKSKDFETYRGQIQNLIGEEIMGRAFYQEGRVATILRHDLQADKAIEIISIPEKYFRLLSPPLSH